MEMRMRETGIWCGISRSWGGKREGRLLNSRRCSTLFIRKNPKLVSIDLCLVYPTTGLLQHLTHE